MSEAIIFLLLIIVFYIFECINFLPYETVILVHTVRGKIKLKYPSKVIGTRTKGLYFSNLIPAWSLPFYFFEWPLKLNEKAILNINAATLESLENADSVVDLKDLDKIITYDNKVLLKNGSTIDFNSHQSCEQFKALFEKIKKTESDVRRGVVAEFINDRFSAGASGAKLPIFSANCSYLIFLIQFEFLLIFLGIPYFLISYNMLESLFLIIPIIYLLNFTIAALYLKASKKIYASYHKYSWSEIFLIFFFPLSTLRAIDKLSVNLYFDLDPLIVLKQFEDDELFMRLFSKRLRRHHFPDNKPKQVDNRANEIEEFWDNLSAGHYSRLLESMDMPFEKILVYGLAKDADSKYYCPRCLSTYTKMPSKCSDCDFKPLKIITDFDVN